ncbi:MAG: DUF2867 domain-containing protein [Desulfovibrionaceae bacterium]|jgi:hypothetical protein|nr:DUF2867 domain-containing protein [Desulfovibrionaceae bacterium]
MRIESVPTPSSALAAADLGAVHHADAFQADLPPGVPADPDRLALAVFGDFPAWVRSLLRLRNALVRPLGLKCDVPATGRDLPAAPLRPGDAIRLFQVKARSESEIVFGAEDRHLDFRVTLRVLDKGGGTPAAVLVSTFVHFHNRLGRVYFALIRPFHVLVVRAALRRGLAALGA